MKPSPEFLVVQRRPTRAGAQTSLFRIVRSSSRRLVTLCAETGWLVDALPGTMVEPWPSPRSLPARLGGLSRFARKIAPGLPGLRAIIANDHQECPVALALARNLGIPCVAILRSSGMSQKDFSKYLCHHCHHLFAVGDQLYERVKRWTTIPSTLFVEGFLEEEFLPAPEEKKMFPARILVVGSERPGKGFPDFLEALKLLQQQEPAFPIEKVVFTGKVPSGALPALDCSLEFAGRITDFIPFARQFDFAIHPSRHETFGLAPLELIISGIPTLCTQTGCLDPGLLPASWLVPASSPPDLARALRDWREHWAEHRAHLAATIESIRQHYHIEKTLVPFFETLEHLTAQPQD